MHTVIARVWLPDRPGALGQVASRIGAAGGEIVGIDILERGGGRAIDELAIQLPDAGLLGRLIAAIGEVDGVDVEDTRPVDGGSHDPRSDALETAAIIIGASDRAGLLESVVSHGRRLLGGTWTAVLRLDEGHVIASEGPAPTAAWLRAFVEGSRSSARVASGETGPDDVVWAPMPGAGLVVVVGREGTGFRARERRQVSAIARIADTRLLDFARRSHPSSQR